MHLAVWQKPTQHCGAVMTQVTEICITKALTERTGRTLPWLPGKGTEQSSVWIKLASSFSYLPFFFFLFKADQNKIAVLTLHKLMVRGGLGHSCPIETECKSQV
jgi:hypothetical protein